MDDEPLARRRIIRALRDETGLSVVGEAGDTMRALDLIRREKPDLLLLDLQMPGESGLELLENLGPLRPAVIFVSALDDRVISAFKAHQVDYVLKPIEAARLLEVVRLVRSRAISRQGGNLAGVTCRSITALRGELDNLPASPTRLWVIDGTKQVCISPTDIDWAAADGDLVRVHAKGATYLHHGAQVLLADLLNAGSFVQVDRSVIVRRSSIAGIEKSLFGSLQLILADSQRIRVGRHHRQAVRSAVSKRGVGSGSL